MVSIGFRYGDLRMVNVKKAHEARCVTFHVFLMANELKISGQCEKNLLKGGT